MTNASENIEIQSRLVFHMSIAISKFEQEQFFFLFFLNGNNIEFGIIDGVPYTSNKERYA